MKYLIATAIALLFTVSLSTQAAGNLASGNQLLIQCNDFLAYVDSTGNASDDVGYNSGHCLGVIKTSSFMVEALNRYAGAQLMPICFYDATTYNQLVRVVVAYLKANPTKLHMHAVSLTLAAYNDGFPCTGAKP
jgi:hypothetical protein